MTLFDDMGPEYGRRYREAIQKETEVRDESFVDAPEIVCGVEVRPMTVGDFALLVAIRSPFVCGGRLPDATDAAMFLWLLSPDYEFALWWRQRLERVSRRIAAVWFWNVRRRFVKRMRKLDAVRVLAAIRDYLEDTFLDGPGGSRKSEDSGVAYWSAFASTVDTFASAYHWSEAEIRKVTLRRAWQYLRIIQKKNDRQCILFNPSDSVRGEWLREQNGAEVN